MMINLTNKLLAVDYNISGPGIAAGTDAGAVTSLEKIISTSLGVLTIVGVIFFVIQIILSGYTLLSSKGDPKNFQVALSKLIHNLIGLLIIVVAYGVTAFLAKLMGLGNNIFDLTTIINSFRIK